MATNEELVANALANNKEAFAAIYDRYSNRIYSYALSVLRSRPIAAEVTLDTFNTAFHQLGELSGPNRLKPWLYQVARQRLLEAVYKLAPVDELDSVFDDVGQQPYLEVWNAAGKLEPEDRDILDLHLRQGLRGRALAYVLKTGDEEAEAAVVRSTLGFAEHVESSLSQSEIEFAYAEINLDPAPLLVRNSVLTALEQWLSNGGLVDAVIISKVGEPIDRPFRTQEGLSPHRVSTASGHSQNSVWLGRWLKVFATVITVVVVVGSLIAVERFGLVDDDGVATEMATSVPSEESESGQSEVTADEPPEEPLAPEKSFDLSENSFDLLANAGPTLELIDFRCEDPMKVVVKIQSDDAIDAVLDSDAGQDVVSVLLASSPDAPEVWTGEMPAQESESAPRVVATSSGLSRILLLPMC